MAERHMTYRERALSLVRDRGIARPGPQSRKVVKDPAASIRAKRLAHAKQHGDDFQRVADPVGVSSADQDRPLDLSKTITC